MAWTAPRTWVTGEQVTAAIMNSAVRDNFLETSAATVTTAGDIAFADAANSMGSRLAIGAAGRTLVSTGSAPIWREFNGVEGDATNVGGSTTFLGFNSATWSAGTNVVQTVVTDVLALVLFGCSHASNDTAGQSVQLSFIVTGAPTLGVATVRQTLHESSAANDRHTHSRAFMVSLTGGTNTFTLQGAISANTGSVVNPYLYVMAL